MLSNSHYDWFFHDIWQQFREYHRIYGSLITALALTLLKNQLIFIKPKQYNKLPFHRSIRLHENVQYILTVANKITIKPQKKNNFTLLRHGHQNRALKHKRLKIDISVMRNPRDNTNTLKVLDLCWNVLFPCSIKYSFTKSWFFLWKQNLQDIA